MQQTLWNKIKSEFSICRIGTLPGISAIAIIIFARLIGSLQFLELTTFDILMRLRPQETVDERILIVGINEDDIRKIKKYPIPDRDIASLLQELQTYQPAVIGLDIYRDLPVEPGNNELITAFKNINNLIAVEQILPDIGGKTVNPPPFLSEPQIGFADAIIDADGKQRRSLLAASNLQDEWRLSLSLKLAEKYLENKRITLENVEGDDLGMRFGSTKLVRFESNSGGYVGASNMGGTQMLINFRSHPQPFEVVSLQDVLDKKVEADKIRNKIVLVGITSPSIKDYVTLEATKSQHSAFIYGIEIQAHIVSQIISAVEDGRVLLKAWWEGWEYVWIIGWGFIGIVLGRTIRSPLKLLLIVTVVSLFLIGISYQLLILGWWIPVVPPLLILVVNGLVLAAFYQYEENLRSQIVNRQLVIDQTFDTIHSGPLQTLAMMLRTFEEEELEREELLSKLKKLNQELRGVYTLLKREAMTDGKTFHVTSGQQIDLREPIHEILHEVYFDVLERDFPCFKTIEFRVIDFQPLDEQNLNSKQKRGICTFLEEALSNVGKYAKNANRLEIICKQHQGYNLIKVADNGLGIESTPNPSRQGFGTQQAQNLARQLKGKFKRFANSPQGTICELTWFGKNRSGK